MTVSAAGAGSRLGRYHLAEPMGGGPTGEVFRAKVYGVAGFERQFAVKRFHHEFVRDPDVAARVAAAARAYGSLEHPRVARLHEFGVAGGETFTAVELVEGIDVARLIDATHGIGRALPVGAAAALISQAGRAIGYAHGRGHGHFGIAPTNLLCTADGEVKVTDFGFLPPRLPARPADDRTLAARIPYLAPEQLVADPASPATDVFQLGVIAYELLTGARPFDAIDSFEVAQKILSAQPPEPPELPKPLLKVLRRCLARSPYERFPDAGAMADAIDAAMRAGPVHGDARDVAAVVRHTLRRIAEISEGQASGAMRFPMPAPPAARADTAERSRSVPARGGGGAGAIGVPSGLLPPRTGLTPPPSRFTPPPTPTPSHAGFDSEDSLTRPDFRPPPLPEPDMSETVDMSTPAPPERFEPPPHLTPPPPRFDPPVPAIPAPEARRELPDALRPRPRANPTPAPLPPQLGRHARSSGRTPPPLRVAGPSAPPVAIPPPLPSGVTPPPVPIVIEAAPPPLPLNKTLIGPAGSPRPPHIPGTPSRGLVGVGAPPVPPPRPPALPPPIEDSVPLISISELAPRPPNGHPGAAIDEAAMAIRRMDTDERTAVTAPPLGVDPAISDVATVPRFSPTSGPPEPFAPSPQASTTEVVKPFKRRRSPLRWVIVLLLFAGLGVGGFYGYTVFIERTSKAQARAPKQPANKQASKPAPKPAPAAAGATKAADEPAEVAAKSGEALAAAESGEAPAAAKSGEEAKSGEQPAAAAKSGEQPAAETKSPVPPPAEPPAATGGLEISSTPDGAKVYLDGTLVGKTPLRLDSTADQHKLAVIKPGFKLHTASVAGKGEVDVPLQEVTPPEGRGGIKVRCKAKDRYYVFVDGRDVGQLCPTERIGADMGPHTVEIYDPVTDSRREFQVQVKQTRLSLRVRVD